MAERVPYLHICITCRAGQPLAEGETPPGRRFHDAVAAVAGRVRVLPVTCLSLCQQGCAAAISAPGKWTYLLGGLSGELVPDLLTYADAYAASASGAVMPSKRPESLASMVRGRFPPMETA